MKDEFDIEIGISLPTVEDLQQILQSYKVVMLKYLSLPDEYVLKLVYSLPCYSFYNREWDPASNHRDRLFNFVPGLEAIPLAILGQKGTIEVTVQGS